MANKLDSAQSKNYFFINQGADAPGGEVTFADQADDRLLKLIYGMMQTNQSAQVPVPDFHQEII